MEEKEKSSIENYLNIDINSRRDNLDDSNLSIHSEINVKKYEEDRKEVNGKLEIIEEETKNYLEELKKGTYNIMVAVRCRPLWNKERDFSEFEIVKILDKKMVILMDPYEYNAPTEVFKNRSREQNYAFDFAFDKTCNQQTVFLNTTKFLLDGVANGYNATVFAYGATGAGKTYTMLGTEDDPGIMPLTLQELFNKIEEYSSEREYKIKLWYIEIYNENIRDLLNSTDEYLDLREDPNKGISIANISELNVTSCRDIMQILRKGNKNRTQESTMANETSSRSHAILQVQVEYRDKITGMEAEIKVGKLSLIDLAGSERASATQNRGIRLIEGANINRSLLTLGNCINALCEASEKGTKPYVPYRDSKLTRLLKDSLGGNSRTVMIANVSPAVTTFDDTYNTLKYANRAKNIKTHVQRNVLSVQYHISNYNNIINNLRNEITDLKQQLSRNQISNCKNNLDANMLVVKKDENKDNFNSNNNYTPNYALLDKCVQELKFHCDEEVKFKNIIMDHEQEINNMISLISLLTYNKDKENKDYNHTLDGALPTDGYSILSKDRDDLTLIVDDKDPLLNSEENNPNILIPNNNEIIWPKIESTRRKSFTLKELEIKLVNMKKLQENYSNRLKELIIKRENMLHNYNKLGIKNCYWKYLQSIIKSHTFKMIIIENKFKEKFNLALQTVKDNYISELEVQIRLRDEIIKRVGLNGLNINNEEDDGKLKSIEQLKLEYSNKFPIIKENFPNENENFNINYTFNENLPPIISKEKGLNNVNSNVAQKINSMLSDLKIVNNNINKIEMIQQKKMKKNEKEIAKEKFNQARNYSQGVRNLNMINDKISINNNNNLVLSNLLSINNPSTYNYPNNNNNSYTLNQRIQLKNGMNKQMKLNKLNNFNNLNSNILTSNNNNISVVNKKYQKDSNSEKSVNYSNNVSHEMDNYDSDIIDIENNNSYEGVKKRNNHFIRKKSLQLRDILASKEESPYNVTPNKNLKKRDDSSNKIVNELQPQIKKKDLNIYINDRAIKSKIPKKMPFKI